MLSDLELMRLHVEAEFTHDAAGQLVATNEPRAMAAPRFFLGRTPGGVICRYRHDVPEGLRRALDEAATQATLGLLAPDGPLDPVPFERLLATTAPIEHTSVGLLFRVPQVLHAPPSVRVLRDALDTALLEPLLPAWVPDVHASQPLAAFLLDGRAVAVCASVRITPAAHEAGVETAAAFRGHGYAAAAVTTWAAAVRAARAEPLYSALWGNTASRALARKLGLVSVGCDLHVT